MKPRPCSLCFSIAFILMLMVPLVTADLAKDRVSEKENRMLAGRPNLTDIKNHPGQFIRDFDAWFRDSTGFREDLIGLHKIIDRDEWNILYMEGTNIMFHGQQGHTFSGNEVQKYQGKPVLSDTELEDFAVNLEKIKKYLDKKNIPFILMLCADKETIYPEFYPKMIKRGPEPIQLELITSYLQSRTKIDVFNVRDALLAEKDKYPLFPKNGTIYDLAHWNTIGAFFGYRELMKHINTYFPGIVPPGLDDVVISCDARKIPELSLKEKAAYEKLDVSFFDGVIVEKFSREPAAFENKNVNSPAVLVLCDSYANDPFFSPVFTQQFRETILIHYANMEHLDQYVTKYKPGIVVLEMAERTIGYAASILAKAELP